MSGLRNIHVCLPLMLALVCHAAAIHWAEHAELMGWAELLLIVYAVLAAASQAEAPRHPRPLESSPPPAK